MWNNATQASLDISQVFGKKILLWILFQMFDLSKETAFNLCLIYKKSGSTDLAAMIAQKYLRV